MDVIATGARRRRRVGKGVGAEARRHHAGRADAPHGRAGDAEAAHGRQPTPVVMVSSVTQHQTPAAVEALMLGAVDMVAKPGGAISLNLADVRDELVAKVRAAAGARLERRPARGCGAAGVYGIGERPSRTGKTRERPMCAGRRRGGRSRRRGAGRGGRGSGGIAGRRRAGDGAGGHRQLHRRAVGTEHGAVGLPEDFPRPVVIVQHMPPGFTASLANRLDWLSPLKVDEAVEQRRPRPGEAWVAPGGVHLVFDEFGRMCYSHDRAAPGHAAGGGLDAGVGGGRVGRRRHRRHLDRHGRGRRPGARKLKKAGGTVLAQDEATSVVYGMPRAVAEMGLADAVKPLPESRGFGSWWAPL